MIARLRFNIKKKEFLKLTYREYNLLYELWGKDKEEKTKRIYESMRIQTFFTYLLNVKKDNNVTYQDFCKKYLPFTWDEISKDEKETKDKLENLTSEDWASLEKRG